MFKRDESGKETTAEPFAEVARFFTESRLLQRDVKIILEGKYMNVCVHPCQLLLLLVRRILARNATVLTGMLSVVIRQFF